MDVSSSLATKYKHHVGRVRSGTFSSNNDTNNVTVYKSPPASSIAEKNTQYSFSSNVVKPRKAVKFNQHSRLQQQRHQLQQQPPRLHRLPLHQPAPLVHRLQLHRQVSEIVVFSHTYTTTTATTIPSCTSPNTAGAIFSFASGSAPTTYTLYTHGFTAAGSSATLSFIMKGDSGPAFHYWLLDTVSVNDTVNNANILVNGGFSTGTLTGWTQYCATNANCG
ncbi:unnamed protein product [Rotaria socialis]|uniref:Uncharacterized protein n=1 Tax=Rotaria socialis TaxID=392032 RepID=A0A820MP19_9BILA|nr:unnamed protein product [Rotaria socialis]